MRRRRIRIGAGLAVLSAGVVAGLVIATRQLSAILLTNNTRIFSVTRDGDYTVLWTAAVHSGCDSAAGVMPPGAPMTQWQPLFEIAQVRPGIPDSPRTFSGTGTVHLTAGTWQVENGHGILGTCEGATTWKARLSYRQNLW